MSCTGCKVCQVCTPLTQWHAVIMKYVTEQVCPAPCVLGWFGWDSVFGQLEWLSPSLGHCPQGTQGALWGNYLVCSDKNPTGNAHNSSLLCKREICTEFHWAPETPERWNFFTSVFHRALPVQLKAISTILCLCPIKHRGYYFLFEQTAWLGLNFWGRHLYLKDDPAAHAASGLCIFTTFKITISG